jgi:hypothetical protein
MTLTGTMIFDNVVDNEGYAKPLSPKRLTCYDVWDGPSFA